MSEQAKRLFIVTKQDELDYWKRKYHELLDYLEENKMNEESKQETPEKEYHEWMRHPGGGVEMRRSDGTIIDAIGELERLIALLREAEAKHESAQKMCDHWEKKAAYWKSRAEEAEAARSNRSVLLGKIESILNAANVVKHHPVNEIGECKLMTLAERVESLVESWNNWEQVSFKNLARAEKAEAERDEWKRRAEKAEAERDELMRKLSEARVKEYWEANEVERQLLRRAEAAEAKLKLQSGLCNTLPVVTNVPIDWQRVLIDAAIAAMQGMLACIGTGDAIERAVIATEYADTLVAELQKKEVQG